MFRMLDRLGRRKTLCDALLSCADIAEAYKKLGFVLFTPQLNCYENLHTLNQQQS